MKLRRQPISASLRHGVVEVRMNSGRRCWLLWDGCSNRWCLRLTPSARPFAGTPDLTYFVERSFDLEEWSVVTEGLAVPGITTVLLPPADGEDHGFYRVRQ